MSRLPGDLRSCGPRAGLVMSPASWSRPIALDTSWRENSKNSPSQIQVSDAGTETMPSSLGSKFAQNSKRANIRFRHGSGPKASVYFSDCERNGQFGGLGITGGWSGIPPSLRLRVISDGPRCIGRAPAVFAELTPGTVAIGTARAQAPTPVTVLPASARTVLTTATLPLAATPGAT